MILNFFLVTLWQVTDLNIWYCKIQFRKRKKHSCRRERCENGEKKKIHQTNSLLLATPIFLPAIVLRNMRYSKLDISRRCHFCVMLEERINCLGDIIEARLLPRKIKNRWKFVIFILRHENKIKDQSDAANAEKMRTATVQCRIWLQRQREVTLWWFA